MRNIIIESLDRTAVEMQQVELVERKGIGHPDSICDAIMEAVSVALCAAYEETFGRIVHHNIDKGLLVAGQTTPQMGGGRVDEPMKLVFGDRATYAWQGKTVPVGEIAQTVARQWVREHLRFVEPDRHLIFQNEIKPASPELADLFARERIGANDTSAAVGYAPLTETERLVLATERYLNSPGFKARYPETGEDVKVMGYRHGRHLTLTVAMAFVDRFIPSEAYYFDRKEAIRQDLLDFLTHQSRRLDQITIDLNTLDVPGRGEAGMYLTVLGTSAEGADCGQVGRGNRVNGVISLNRPMSTEAAAGKNPVSHVGKIYTLLSSQIAAQVHAEVEGIQEVYIWLCSQIGHPIDQPLIASAQLVLKTGVELEAVQGAVQAIIERELEGIYGFTRRLARGELTVW
ncbi:MAG: methionine adenosyltransferase [Nitrospinota bacterium]|nr:MAG: methionine adenosyltransferase [Nitrospinota bacterium]